MEKDCGEQEQRHRSGVLHEQIDPPVGGGPQPADEEEQEQDAEQEENPGRAVLRAPVEHEEPDEEEEETERGRVDIRRPAEPLRGEADLRRAHLAFRLATAASPMVEIGHPFPDRVLPKLG